MDLRRQRRLRIISTFLIVAGLALAIAVVTIFVIPLIKGPATQPGFSADKSPSINASIPGGDTNLQGLPDDLVFLPGQTGDILGKNDGQNPTVDGTGGYLTSPSQPTRLVIPALGIDADVLPVGLEPVGDGRDQHMEWQVPAGYAAGWHAGSAPLGQPGNTVLNGHNNIYGSIFRDLARLEPGREIVLYDRERAYTYQVVQQEYLQEAGQPLQTRVMNARWILPTSDERLTIVTCWPNTSNTHRLVVIARPIPESS